MRDKHRSAILLSVIALTPIGFYLKIYQGPFHTFLNNYGAGALYTTFWTLIAYLFLKKYPPLYSALSAFFATCIIEFTQLWHPPFLEPVRATFIGHALLGSTFSWMDFPLYATGALLGWKWLGSLVRR